MSRLALVALAGACGTLSRYWLGGFVQTRFSLDLPVGTAVVNMMGCFLFGLVWSLGADKGFIRPEWELPLLTGFMGAFTTFSTFVFESDQLLRDGNYTALLLYACGQLALGLGALRLAMALVRTVF